MKYYLANVINNTEVEWYYEGNSEQEVRALIEELRSDLEKYGFESWNYEYGGDWIGFSSYNRDKNEAWETFSQVEFETRFEYLF